MLLSASSLNIAMIGSGGVINGGYLPTTGADLTGITFTNLAPANVNTSNLAAYDTAVLNVASAEMGQNVNTLSAAAKQALVDFVGSGHKLIICDSECPAQNYAWLPYSFATNNPGPMGAHGTLNIVEENTLSSNDPSSSYYINATYLSTATDAVGDANVMTTLDPHWNLDMTARNTNGVTGPVHVYAEYFSPGSTNVGLIIYNGLDTDYMGSGSNSLRKIWVQELRQAFNPSGLPHSLTVVGINLTEATTAEPVGGTHTVVATLSDQLGNPQPNVLVSFHVLSGPNTGAESGGTYNPATRLTDANGRVSFTYTSNGSLGDDVIEAQFTNSLGQLIHSPQVTVTWYDTAPVVTPPSPQNANEGAAQSLDLGSFSDPDLGPWTVDVNWGDGTSHTVFAATTAGPLGVRSHTFAEEGINNVTVTVTDSASLSDAKSFQVTVADPAVVATGGLAISAVEGQAFSNQTVATFTDSGGPETVGDYSAVINWGDGSTSAGTIVAGPTSGGKADVLFLTDTTGSMWDYISDIQSAFSGILGAIQSRLPGMDIQYAVADYRNWLDGGNYQAYGVNLRQSFTADTTLAQDAINTLSADGGCDWPESQLKAMTSISSNWYSASGDLGFGGRLDAQKLLVWAGDSPGHYFGEIGADGPADYYPSLDQTLTALNSAGIKVIGLDIYPQYDGIDTDYGGQYQEEYLTSGTGGTALYSVGSGGPTVEDAVVDSIVTVIQQTFLVQGDHTYAEESAADHPGSNPYQVTVTISHESAPTTTVTSSATVSDPAVVASGGQHTHTYTWDADFDQGILVGMGGLKTQTQSRLKK